MQKTLMMKLIAVMLVLMLSLSNFLVLVSYAAEISVKDNIDVSMQNGETSNNNINFNSYLITDENQTYSAKLNIKDANKVYINIKLANSGYLKAGTVKFEDTSFKIKKQEETVNSIQSIDYDKNEIILNQINGGTEVELEIPIEMIKVEIFNIQNLNKNNKIKFNGTYITEKGKEVSVEKEILLNIQWDSNVEGSIEESVNKYINKINGETLLELNLKSGILKNSMPIKETNIELNVPQINGKYPKYLNVVANSLLATKGKSNGLEFDEKSFKYDETEHKIIVKVENLPNENNEISWKEGLDEYKVTLIYEKNNVGVGLDQSATHTIILNTKAKFDIYGKEEIIETNIENEINLTEDIGNVDEISLTTNTQSIYKSFMYANSKYETEYKINWNLNIGYAKISDKIIISDNQESFVNTNEEKIGTNGKTYYKQTIINRNNFEKILGQEGYIKILNEKNEELGIITLQSTEEEDITINYQGTNTNKVKIETSKPITEGNLEIKHIKAIKAQTDFNKELIKTFAKLENEVNLNVINNKPDANAVGVGLDQPAENTPIEIVLTNSKQQIKLNDPKENIEFNLEHNSLFCNQVNENVGFNIKLLNDSIADALYENPKLRIKLPSYTSKVDILEAKILLDDELIIDNTEFVEETKEIVIDLKGKQTKYNLQSIANGTAIVLKANIEMVGNIEENERFNIKLNVFNQYFSNSIELQKEINIFPPISTEEKETEEHPQEEQQTKEQSEEQQQQNEQIINSNNETLKIKMYSNNTNKNIYERQMITYTVEIENISDENIEGAIIRSNIPEGTVSCEYKRATEEEDAYYEDNSEEKYKEWKIENIVPGQIIQKKYSVRVNKDTTEINAEATVSNDNFETYIISNVVNHKVSKGCVQVDIMTWPNENDIIIPDGIIIYDILLTKIVENIDGAIIAKMSIPDGTSLVEASIEENSEKVTYDENNKLVIWNIDNIEDKIKINLKIKVNKDTNTDIVSTKLFVENKESIIYESHNMNHYIDKNKLEIKYSTNIEEGYISEEQELIYEFSITNISKSTISDVKINDLIPEGLNYEKMVYQKNDEELEINSYGGNRVDFTINYLLPNETAYISIYTKTKVLEFSKDIEQIKNSIDINVGEEPTYQTIEINHILENNNASGSTTKEGTYRITGVIWNDSNADGKRDTSEKMIDDATVFLIDANTNNIAKDYLENEQIINTKTGVYTFNNVENGKYYIVFLYDSNKYAVTEQQKIRVEESKNSDAIQSKINIDGQERNVGITNMISVENNNIYGIDLGLINQPRFDLEIDKYINKVDILYNNGTTETTNYNYEKFAKKEIHSKLIEGAVVNVEYTISIKNKGQVSGYVNDIVDYASKDLVFDERKNSGWVIGEDGILHNTSLANLPIEANEEKKVTLILTKNMTGENTGIFNNNAEIQESHSINGTEDDDSIGGNKSTNEDDLSNANIIISVKTGKTRLYISLIITLILTLGIGTYYIKRKVLEY